MSEWEQIAEIRRRIAEDPRVRIGIGDDTAYVVADSRLLITVDMLVEGVHFNLDGHEPYRVGRKAMNVNISDIAAMAGEPTFAVVAIAVPPNRSPDLVAELYRGLCDAAKTFDVVIVGGDTNRSPRDLCISVTLMGKPVGDHPATRSGAKPGDGLFVTGPLGYSLDGKHLDFVPRIPEAAWLYRNLNLTSMIDLSDGLGSDLFHLTEQSGCGAKVDGARIPIRRPNRDWVDDGRTPLEHALHDGEDFELLFTADPQSTAAIVGGQLTFPHGLQLYRIGEMTAGSDVLLANDRACRKLDRGGFEHRW